MSVALAFVTIERPHAAARLIRSARRFLPDVPIYVADQSANTHLIDELYAVHAVKVIRMPFDSGLAASRNALVNAISEKYFLLCDDDFELCEASRLDDAVAVLDAAPDIAVVGGRLHDIDESGERVRNWEMYFQHDRRNSTFTAIPIYNFAPHIRKIAGREVFLCDAVLNFCVFRKSAFSTQVRWDEAIKINGEHEDFYLNLKVNTDWKVGYLPSLAALHCPPPPVGGYVSRLRSRKQGWQYFLSKWNLKQHLEIGTGTHTLGTSIRQWFSDASAAHGDSSAIVRAASAAEPPAGISTRRLRVSFASSATQPGGEVHSHDSPLQSLTEPLNVARFDACLHDVRFCYAPHASAPAMLAWYRFQAGASERPSSIPGHLALHVRWFDDAGSALMWDAGGIAIERQAQPQWTPFVMPMPLWPRHAKALRFEILAACGADRVPVATGLVFGPASDSAASENPVMAFALPTRDQPSERAGWLTDASADQRSMRRLLWRPASSELSASIDLRQPSLQDVDMLYFVDWQGLGRRITMLDQTCTRGASTVALPGAPDRQARVVAILKSGSRCDFELAT